MSATPGMVRLIAGVTVAFPDVGSLGVYNPRHIANDPSRPWSQHAGCEPDRDWWGNAWDIAAPADIQDSTPERLAYLDSVHAFLAARRRLFDIYELIWRSSNHYDHIHVSTYPRMVSWAQLPHPTKGGAVKTLSRDGLTRSTYKLEEVLTMARGLMPGDEGRQVKVIQRQLNRVRPVVAQDLEVDGIYGPLTTAAVTTYQVDREIPDADGVMDGYTRSDLYMMWRRAPKASDEDPGADDGS